MLLATQAGSNTIQMEYKDNFIIRFIAYLKWKYISDVNDFQYFRSFNWNKDK